MLAEPVGVGVLSVTDPRGNALLNLVRCDLTPSISPSEGLELASHTTIGRTFFGR